MEPTHDNAVRTTATSAAEGRMKSDYAGKKKKKRRILNKYLSKY